MRNLSLRGFYCVVWTALTLALLGAGCERSEPQKTRKVTTRKPKPSYIIGMSQCNLSEPWRVEMNAQIKAAAKKHPNLTVIFKDAQNDTLKQRAQVEEFVSAGVDLLIISPKEAQPLTEPVAKAMEAGIPVIVLDCRLVGDQFTCYIGADDKKSGGSEVIETALKILNVETVPKEITPTSRLYDKENIPQGGRDLK